MKTFKLGFCVITKNALKVLNSKDISIAMRRHKNCDWGDVGQEDKAANNAALDNNNRILSAYHDSHGAKFWIITEADRSATTILLPDDY